MEFLCLTSGSIIRFDLDHGQIARRVLTSVKSKLKSFRFSANSLSPSSPALSACSRPRSKIPDSAAELERCCLLEITCLSRYRVLVCYLKLPRRVRPPLPPAAPRSRYEGPRLGGGAGKVLFTGNHMSKSIPSNGVLPETSASSAPVVCRPPPAARVAPITPLSRLCKSDNNRSLVGPYRDCIKFPFLVYVRQRIRRYGIR
ncbi:hypothetical protein EVAR_86967_1 [Eumeta japonica]|uniref:Uncharacterized protein n=1 Tax=Eumeta variegata TaxID=151549 RepID=A0A4C1W9A2_EUMVA|nr:hypothetical protein EVAR_86967_1 [Eumeta japonica]